MKLKLGILSFLFIANILFLISNWRLISNIASTSPNTLFPLIHRSHVDYYGYISYIRESAEGSWGISALFTSEEVSKKFIYIFYIAAGKLAHLTSIDPIWVYHLLRMIGYELFFIFLYLLVSEIVGLRKAFWASIIGLLSTIPFFMFFWNIFDSKYQLSWWVSMDVLGRLDFPPHHIFGITGMFSTILFLFKFIRKTEKRDLLISAFLAFITGFIFPFSAIALVFGIFLTLLVYGINYFRFKRKIDYVNVFGSGLVVLMAMISIFVMKNITESILPWSYPNIWEVNMWNGKSFVDRDILVGGGVLLLTSLPTIFYLFIRSSSYVYIFLGIWAILPYMLLPFSNMLGIGKIRVIAFSNFIPLSILSLITLEALIKRIRKPNLQRLLFASSFIIFILVSLPATFFFYQKKMDEPHVSYININIPISIIRSIEFIKKNVPPYSRILSFDYIGGMLPAFVNVKSYLGHPTLTINYADKMFLVNKFFSGNMEHDEVREFLKNGGIDYIYIGPTEMGNLGVIEEYNLPIKEIYNTGEVLIYRLN